MKFKKALGALALGVAAMGTAPAFAVPVEATLTNAEPTALAGGGPRTITGFDWSQGGTAFTTNFTAQPNSTFSITYYAVATALSKGSGNAISQVLLDATPNGVKGDMMQNALAGFLGGSVYEYTIVANLQEQVVGNCVAGAACNFKSLGGSWAIYYDTAADAHATNGTGYYNGTKILEGIFTSGIGSGGFTATTPGNGAGVSDLFGKVTYQNTNFIQGNLTNIVLGTTLQQGSSVTNGYTRSAFDPSAAAGDTVNFAALANSPTFQLLQADGNLSFVTAVPEPNALALVGVALGAGAFFTRRRKSKQQ